MTIQDWGITYDELEPYYDKFEYMAGIAGKAGNLKGQKIAGGNVFEGPRSREFPLAPPPDTELNVALPQGRDRISATTRSSRRRRTCRRRTRTPTAIARGPCTYCGFCERFGCEVGAKADPTIDRDPGRAEDRQVQDDRPRQRVRDRQRRQERARASSTTTRMGQCRSSQADVIVLGAYVFNNVRLLLDVEARQAVRPGHRDAAPSAGTTPTRPAAAARAAGSSTASSTATWAPARTRSRSTTSTPTTSTTRALGFIGGGSISLRPERRPADPEPDARRPARRPSAATGRSRSSSTTSASISVGFQGESPAYRHALPRPRPELPRHLRQPAAPDHVRLGAERAEDGRLRRAADARDHAADHPEGTAAPGRAADAGELRRTSSPAGRARCRRTTTRSPYQSTHNTGGAIMGADPNTSVVNNYLQMWDAPNVFVVGACNFPQNAGLQPDRHRRRARLPRRRGRSSSSSKNGGQPGMSHDAFAEPRRLRRHVGRRPRTDRSSRTPTTRRRSARTRRCARAIDVYPIGDPPSGFYMINV